MLETQNVKLWTPFTWIRRGPIVSFCEHNNEPLGPTEGREFLNLASTYQLYMGNKIPLLLAKNRRDILNTDTTDWSIFSYMITLDLTIQLEIQCYRIS
jgi:hypothetical protein